MMFSQKLFLMSIFMAALITSLALADDNVTALRQAAKSVDVQQDLTGPDGCSIKGLATDNWKLICLGSSTYDFNDADDRQDAMNEATLSAKSKMAAFFREQLDSEKTLDKNMAKVKKQTAEGKKVLKLEMKKTATTIKNRAKEILRGVITLEATVKWNGSDGVARVKIGQSSKTLGAAEKIRSAINADARPKTKPVPTPKTVPSAQPLFRKRTTDSEF
jgi:hypothetical protein